MNMMDMNMMDENKKSTILVVDDDICTLRFINSVLSEDYTIHIAKSGEEAVAIVQDVLPDLILLDIVMPGMNGYETIERIKQIPSVSRCPIIVLSAKDDAESEVDGLSRGAADYISKPCKVSLLRKRIELHLLVKDQKKRLEEQNRRLHDYNENLQKIVGENTQKIVMFQHAILNTMAELVEFRNYTTRGHIERIQLFLKALIGRMIKKGLNTQEIAAWDIELIVEAALFHDLGKIQITDSILNKPAKLTVEEFEIVKHHADYGKEAIQKIAEKVMESELLQQASIMAYSHHERWDGTGYPLGLKGIDIPLQGRLMAIIDVYDTLISERPYKIAYSHKKAVEIIMEGKGTQFDPALVECFSEIAQELYNLSQMNSYVIEQLERSGN